MRFLAALLLTACGVSTPAAEYPSRDCRSGVEFTYYSDGTWSSTASTECDTWR